MESQFPIQASLSVGESNASFVTWSQATTLNTVASLVSQDYSYNTLIVTLKQSSTITQGTVTFQGSLDGTNWFNLEGITPGTTTIIGPTYNLQNNTYAAFEFNLTAIPYFQVLLSTVILGTGTVIIGYAADSFVNANSVVYGTVGITGATFTTAGSPPVSSLNVFVSGQTVWGTAPAVTVDVQAVNAELFAGQTALSATGSALNVSAVGTLTNNNAAPGATLIGVLPAIAETAYSTVTYTTGDMVLPVTDLHGALNSDLQAWAGTALGAAVNFGTTPGAVIAGTVNASMFSGTTALGTPNTFGTTAPTGNALGVNASLFMGTTLARTNQTTTATGVVDVNVVGNLGVTNAKTNGVFTAICDQTNVITAAISALGTAPTGTEVMAVNAVNIPNASLGAATSLVSSHSGIGVANVKGTAGNLYGFNVFFTATSTTTTQLFLQFWNTTNTTLANWIMSFAVYTGPAGVTGYGTGFCIPPGAIALANFSNGITISLSTTYSSTTTTTTGTLQGTVFYL
jgi:hypothetical protein